MPTKKPKVEEITCIPVGWLELAPTPFFLLDHKGRIVWINESFERLTGYDRGGIIGARFDRLFSRENIAGMLEDFMKLYKGEGSTDHPYDFLRENGSSLHVTMDMTPILSESSQAVRHVFGNIRSHYELD